MPTEIFSWAERLVILKTTEWTTKMLIQWTIKM